MTEESESSTSVPGPVDGSDSVAAPHAAAESESDVASQAERRRWVPAAIGLGTAVAVFVAALVLRSIFGGGDAPDAGPEASQPHSSVTAKSSKAPRTLKVPSIGLTADVLPILVDPKGVLTPPPSPEVGWWKYSAKPGAGNGQTLITGHTIHDGTGIMNRLGDVKPGAEVDVVTGRGTVTYRTTKVEVLSKEQIAEHADELFGQDRGDGRLVLVTCDDWEDGEYLSNIVLYAMPVRGGAAA